MGCNKPVVVNLIGGIGNQLFCYAAGTHLSQSLDHQVIFDTYPGSRGANHGFSLENRNLPGVFIQRSRFEPSRALAGLSIWGQRKSPALARVLPPITGSQWCDSPILPTVRVRPGGTIEGYFQTTAYLEAVWKNGISRESLISVAGKSSWLQAWDREISKQKPIVVHLRRGDYLSHWESFGLLGYEYYRNALAVMYRILGPRTVWVFSDDERGAKSLLEKMHAPGIVLSAPAGSDPVESLYLMSQGSGIIIANSTFSWWAAALSAPSTRVIVPDPWFRETTKPHMYLPSWIKVPSHFRDRGDLPD